MEGGGGMMSKNPTKTLLLLLLAFLSLCAPASSQPLHSEPMATQYPPSSPPPPPPPQSKIPRAQAGAAARLRRIALGVLFGSLTGFLLALAFLYAIREAILHAKNAPAIVKGPVSFNPQISPKNLQAALPSAQLFAHGPHGKYYKLALDNDLTVAVKLLDTANRPEASPSVSPNTSKSDMRRVQRQLEALARVRHQNVMTLKAYVREADRLSLVYDFVPGGSLEDVMKRVRSQQFSLNWDARSRIAVGIAKGLRHLHFECSPMILHCNLKPSNVMLDEGFEPILTDCGVARLIAAGSGDPEWCSGLYAAPECHQSSRYTDKSDVYGLGMILGVLLTGRDPTDPFFSGETGRVSLARWLRHMQQSGEAKEALDSSILGEEVEEEEMFMAVRVAIVCLSDLPADRPSSDELVAMLTQLHSL
ncbi:inactive leucine-rich repeat receptor-like protein kinase CORYNE [Phragmites australis]|uniref:inactive leucine-rich repeat receptor-like protein kinase CORYNE n=1 Tax=Phragmites australis TaxID=29695 RepID=UPI002D76F0C2|nr:inactive leucine-rich repeat receptor-like protein kinase CORYNE [Phragmites australis]XP_062207965.1 inactive leucine-rich repeat receptor-like protein kinase CORYNE [Phragmites australis]XP_062207966.1 inactive leucine-rich repeat receptor-like protein kinase CORYNE [Phragmites australis]